MYEATFVSIGSIKSRRVGKLDMVVQDTDLYPIFVTHVMDFVAS